MSVSQITSALITITLFEMMLAIGLGVALREVAGVVADWRLAGRAALANYVCVPVATVGLLLLFGAQPTVSAGFLILAVCPGAPYGLPFTAVARGSVPVAAGLMAVLAGSSAVAAPVLLRCLLPLVAGGEALTVDAARIVGTLLVTQLVPLALGLAVRHWRPSLAAGLQGPLGLLSKMLNLAVVGLVLVTQFDLLAQISPRAYGGMLILLVVSWAAGWLLSGRAAEVRKAMTLTASLRNVGVGLVIANSAFAGTPAVTAVLAYGLFAVLGSLFLALAWGRVRRPRVVAPPREVGVFSEGDVT